MRLSAVALRVVVALLAILPARVGAQSVTDVIRGRVTSDSGRIVTGATVFVTRGPDRAFKQTTTDSAGRYAVTFENGTGDYLVAVNAVGLKSARRRVQRQSSERELVADFTLATDISTLATVKVTADKPERASVGVGPAQLETGASERWADGVTGQLAPSQLGSLSALTGNMPGVTIGMDGPSLLGAGSSSNLTTLNGMALPGGVLPRAARVDTRVTGATFDAVRGGFSGANTDVRLGAASRDYRERNAYLTLDARGLQATDAVGRALGVPSSSVRTSFGSSGRLVPHVLTYNAAFDFARSTSDPATLLRGDAAALLAAGVSRDSVARLQTAAGTVGLPLRAAGIPVARENTSFTWLSRVDDVRDTLTVRYFTTVVGVSRDGAQGFAPLNAPSTGGESQSRNIGVQFQQTLFVGEGRRILNQTRLGLSQQYREGNPYLLLPGASVLVRSTGASGSGIVPLTVGGNSGFDERESRWTGEASTMTAWNARGRKHTFKVSGWARGDAVAQAGGADRLGRFTFNSIDDFAAGRPATFSRVLRQPDRTGEVWNSAVAVSHAWSPARRLGILYGARIEANGALAGAARNPALESALRVPTGRTPTLLHVSPRAGFSYTYSRMRNNGNGMSMNESGSFFRTSTGVIRGGIGEFRDLLQPDLLADAAARTGLVGSTQSLLCTGSAVPVPDWSDFAIDPSRVPSQCLGGGGVLTDAAPPATLIARDYDVPRSWRASLDWNTNVGWLLVKWNNLASWDLSQPSVRDANFAGTPRFVLAAEGNRPVYVSTAGIDAASGAVSSVESRRSAAFGRVAVRGSELRGYGGQTTITLQPDVFRTRDVPLGLYGAVSYTLQQVRRQYLGFDGLTAGDPRLREWAPAGSDARHAVQVQGAMTVPGVGSFTLFMRAQSGLPFTPQVQGDVNGDGRSGDRAFVPATGDAALVAQLQALRSTGSPTAQRCLSAFAGQLAPRNSCRGPWTATMNAQWHVKLPKRLQRVGAYVFVENVLGGVDQLLHGSANLRGWGGMARPDPVLLVPRGFDAGTRSFRYDVNPRFGETRPSFTTLRAPFRITLDFRVGLSTDFQLQELRTALEPVRVNNRWQARSVDSLTALYLRETSNIHTAALAESDSLFLTADQTVALKKAETAFGDSVRAIYGALARYLAQYAGGAATKAALDSSKAAKKAYWRVFWEQPEIAGAILTSTQRELMPMLKEMLTVPKANRLESQWYFGSPVKFVPQASPGAVPGPTGSGAIRPPGG